MRRYQRQLSDASDTLENLPQGATKDTSIRAVKAGIALLPVLWRDLNRR